MKKFKPSIFPALAWFSISTLLLIMPGSSIPTQHWLGDIHFDKWIHVGMFALLVFLICWCYPWARTGKNLQSIFIAIAVGCLCYGIVMEFVQKYFVANRSFDVWDIVADAAGCALGMVYSKRRVIQKIDPCGNRGRNQN